MKKVTVTELKALMDSGSEFQLIDVREPHEFEFANLGAELIPLHSILNHIETIAKDKQVIFHCRSGARSGQAVLMLETQYGMENLYNLEGGILAWSDQIDPKIPKY